MTLDNLTTIKHLERFLDGSEPCTYQPLIDKDECYPWIQGTLVRFHYLTRTKQEKGLIRRFIVKISGYSRQQVTRLITQYTKPGRCIRGRPTGGEFARRYADADIRRLAELAKLHEAPCGAVIKKLCERAVAQGDSDYEGLAKISVSHIYNLRRSSTYQNQRRHFSKTQPKKSTIGERRKPNPEGMPGYLRVDTVHQGDQDKQEGAYHINLVDEETQFEISVSVERIGEHFMEGALSEAMARFPFKILGFHSDNGSEFINKTVAKLLQKLLIEFTKSRARQSNDNALVESKNGSVVRKLFPQHGAKEINQVLLEPMYRYLNFHRPCFFPTIVIDSKGKQKKKYEYKNLMTPFEKLSSIDNIEAHLKEGVTLQSLHDYANAMTDTQAAKALPTAKQQLFARIFKQSA